MWTQEAPNLMATDLSWDMQSIKDIFSSRWLIEVFFEETGPAIMVFAVWPSSVVTSGLCDH